MAAAVISKGYVLALTVICALQYVAYLDRLERLRRRMARDAQELVRLQSEVFTLQQDRAQIQFENQIFEEFLRQRNHEAAMGLLLKRFIPKTRSGFGALLERRDKSFAWCQTRGFSSEELTSLSATGEWLREFDKQSFLIYDKTTVRDSFIYEYIPPADRKRIQQLFLFPIRHDGEITGILLSTALYPAGMPVERRIALALRLLEGLESHFRQSKLIRSHKSRLKTTQEMLELHSITDQRHKSVKALVEAFLTCLNRQVGADRMLIAFSREQKRQEVRSIERVGLRPDPAERDAWENDERHLIKIGLHRKSTVVLDPAELDIYGFDGPLQEAVLTPLEPREGTVGILCAMRHGDRGFSRDEIKHIKWSAAFLGEYLRRSLDHAMIEMQATCDALTGLLNRRVFDERLQREIQKSQQHGHECALLLVDLDHFKSINDRFGHLAGDVVLRRTAETIKNLLEAQADLNRPYAARYGGEELGVILSGVSADRAYEVAESLRCRLTELDLEFKDTACPVTASIGLAIVPTNATTAEELIAAADKALYRAKSEGRNRVCAADQENALASNG